VERPRRARYKSHRCEDVTQLRGPLEDIGRQTDVALLDAHDTCLPRHTRTLVRVGAVTVRNARLCTLGKCRRRRNFGCPPPVTVP
jgi:hypothetical protein